MSDIKRPRIGFAGMSHLGLITATAIASKGFPVCCYDADARLIEALQKDQCPIEEPQLNELLASNGQRQHFTNALNDLATCDIIYIATDVPTSDDNTSDLTPIQQLADAILTILPAHATVVVLSQVCPGFCRQLAIPKQQLYYQVETLIFGQAIHRALMPERYIIGCADPKQPLPAALQQLLQAFNCPILPMRYESAELAKISINLYLVSSVTTSNMLAELCTQIGADWNEIIPTLQLDKRIGRHAYLKPGLGISGGNLERDLATTIKLGQQHHTDTQTISAWVNNSHYQKTWVCRCLEENVLQQHPQAKIAVLGLAYKANTHSIKNSPSIVLLRALTQYQVMAHDPVVTNIPVEHITIDSDLNTVIQDADVLVMMTPWAEYQTITPKTLQQTMTGNIILDPLQILDHAAFRAQGFTIHTLGNNTVNQPVATADIS
jgi:UDPglucose 6-dehydrogenase